LQLRSLEIQGFKSFPDKTKLNFTNGLTAVVGPNGSGKSNIADAVRWVLGEQSTKTLRGNKMEDVIFGGTQTRKPQGFASVALTIDNTQRRLPVESDEVCISRKLYRSGESEYRINGTSVRLKDIYELFMDTGMGRDGYSIIGQGKIAEIVSAKSTQRREIFEEAAGISKYRYRKEEAERRLEQAEENLLRLKDILSELEARVEPLKIQAEKASQFVKYSDEKKMLEVSLWIETLENSKQILREHRDKLVLAQNRHNEIEENIQSTETAIAEIYSQMQECSVFIEQKRDEIKGCERTKAETASKIAVLNNDIGHNKQSIEKLNLQIEQFGEGSQNLDEQIEQKKAAVLQHEKEAAELKNELSRLDETIMQTKAEQKELLAQIELREDNSASLASAINEAKLANATSTTLIDDIISRLENISKTAQLKHESLRAIESELQNCKELDEVLNEKISSNLNTKSGYSLKRKSREEKLGALNVQKRELLEKARESEQRAKLIEDMENNMEGFGQSVKFIVSQVKANRLNKVLGTVSQLISTDDKYSTAIETALGAAMQNIVVEDENTAKHAINLLKQSKAGRATFLPLTSVKGSKLAENGLQSCDGFIGLGCELVSFDKKYEGIVNSLLGRIAVAEDLDSAVDIAKKYGYRFRIVTLDGQLVNAGGSLTGGFTAKSAGILNRRSEIAALREKSNELNISAKKLDEQINMLAQELAELDAHLSGIDAENKTYGEDLIRCEAEQKRLIIAKQEAMDAIEASKHEHRQLSLKLQELKRKNASSDEVLENLTAELNAANSELKALLDKRDKISELLQQQATEQNFKQMQLISKQKDLETAQLVLEQALAQKESYFSQIDDLKSQSAELVQQNIRLEQEINELTAQAAQLDEKIKSAQSEIELLNATRLGCEQRTTELRAKEKELAAQKEGFSRELARLEERQNSLQDDYDRIIMQLWDEYELTPSQASQLAQKLDDKQQAQRRLNELKNKIKALGTVNLAAIEEYKEVSERYTFMKAQVDDVEKSRDELRRLIGDLTDQMKTIFIQNFQLINKAFQSIFVELFGGGKAELTLTDETDVLQTGIEIFVQPPGKIIKSLGLLSGGEQSFVAIAIYFAILKVRPAPFCLLDEIEAALDDVNVSRFAQYLHRLSGKTQFIAITHRRGTMEEADMLYGVTMQEEGVSKLLELNVSEIESKLGIK